MALQPLKSYLSIPTRPPAESWVKAPDADALQKIYSLVLDKISFIDLLFETEAADFTSTGNLVEDILGITAVHPLREQALRHMLLQAGSNWWVVEGLLACDKLRCIPYGGENYFIHGGYDSNKVE